ncbi:hypothetical protein SAMN06295909_0993 [Plantibacter sp. VKM Ac-1784]|uniref:Uncharacterized protein n=1 Tax=Plantibacter elymi (nom. nud.) TaxID=199708 RepID=A0ABY1R9P2_9MICO|nr:hypothetical protein [Plantibacter sp. VKM Ac-1784]SMQ64205.1 hypothetical protein SAMN06295909_0993 [Plantibacter sp. VKM Ac-1784]
MSSDGTGRGGAGLPDEPADGTDWLLSQLDADDTEAIETQPATDAVDEQPSAAVAPVPADDDDRTRVLPVVGDTDAQAAASPVPTPVPAEPQWSVPSVPDAPATPTAAERTPAPVEPVPAPVEQTPAAAEPTPAAPATAPGEFASEAELLAWWQSQVPTPADDPTPVPAPPTPDAPSAEPAAPAAPAAPADPMPEEAPVRSEGLRHPNALELPVVPPTPAPASPVPPARNELTVDTDSVLQHAPAGTFRPAPTNPVVLPPVDDEPWSLGGSDDSDDDARTAPEDVSTAVLPTARALAADDPAAWAAVEAEETGATNATSTPGGTPAAPLPPTAPPVMPTPTAADHDVPSGSATTPDTDVQDDDLPEGSWSLSETFGDDVLGGETVEIRDTTIDASAPADTGLDEAPDDEAATDDVWTAEQAPAEASAPRTDPLAWLTEPFGATFGAAPAAPEEQSSEEPHAEPVDEAPQQLETADESVAAPDEATSPVTSEPVQPTADSDPEPASDGIVASAPITPAAPFRWDTVAAASPASAAEPTSPADVPWPEAVPDVDAEPLDETRPFDSLGGPGFSALAGAAAAAAVVPPAPTPVPDADTEPDRHDASVDDGATDTADVPPAFGPPTPKAERSITELISLDGVQPEPTVSPFGTAPFVWDLAPNDALDPLVHAAPTTQPIPVPPVEWEGAESSAVSAESPSELALEGEVPDAAFIAGDVQPFAPGLAAVTLGRPLVDGPGDEFASWTDDATDTDSSAPDAAPIVPAANDTVDLFPTLSLGGFDAAVAAGGLAAAGAATAAGAAAGIDSGDDTETTAEHDADLAPATAPTPVAETSAPETPTFAVDPEELDDEFDEEIVEFDAVPLAAAGVTPLPSFVPDGAVADDATDPATDAAASDAPLADEGSIDPEPVGEPEPVSEELRLESLFDLGPETDAVEVASADDAAGDGEPAATPPADTEQTVDAAAAAPSDQPNATATATAASARSLADTFVAEGGWSLQADAIADPDLPLAPIPGLVAADGTDVDDTDPDDDTGGSRRNGAHAAGDNHSAPHTSSEAEPDVASNTAPTPVTPASVSVFGAHAAAVPSQGPVANVPQTAPAALPGETVAFPELDGASALTTPAAAAGIVGATLPPQATQSAPDRDLPEYRGEHADQGIPKALIWAVVGLGAAVLLLLAFYFGTLVGAANAAGAAADATMPSASAGWSATGAPDTL